MTEETMIFEDISVFLRKKEPASLHERHIRVDFKRRDAGIIKFIAKVETVLAIKDIILLQTTIGITVGIFPRPFLLENSGEEFKYVLNPVYTALRRVVNQTGGIEEQIFFNEPVEVEIR